MAPTPPAPTPRLPRFRRAPCQHFVHRLARRRALPMCDGLWQTSLTADQQRRVGKGDSRIKGRRTVQPFALSSDQPSVCSMATFMRLFLHTCTCAPSGRILRNFCSVATCARVGWERVVETASWRPRCLSRNEQQARGAAAMGRLGHRCSAGPPAQ
eukprot:366043-Chlamydomonas_euryale.AAC.9